MTKVYFVRHAKPDFSVKDDLIRPLTEEAINDCRKVTEFLSDKNITKVFSSPYKRSFDTIKDFAESLKLKINIIEDFRERKISNEWIEDFNKEFDYIEFERIKNLMQFIVCFTFNGKDIVNIEEFIIR